MEHNINMMHGPMNIKKILLFVYLLIFETVEVKKCVT